MAVVIPLAFFALVGFIVWVVSNNWRLRAQQRAANEFNTRLLDRISSFKDFNDFLASEQGARMLDSLASEHPSTGPRERVLRATHVGIVATTLGLGLLMVAEHLQAEPLALVGGIALAFGLGYLISSAVSYRLARRLGVLETTDHRAGTRPESD
jgi:hypothetical protein